MNKQDHILNGVLVGIVVGALISPTWDEAMFRSIVAVAVPVTLGVLVSEFVSEFGRHRTTLHNVGILGGFIAFPFVFGTLQYVWIGVLTHLGLDHLGIERGIASHYPSTTSEWNLPTGTEMAELADTHIAVAEDVPLLNDETVLERRHPSWLDWGEQIIVAVCIGGFGLLSMTDGPIGLGLLFVVGAGGMGVAVVLDRRNTHYVVTTHRVYIKDGVFQRSTRETRIADIHSLTTDASLPERLVGEGTVRIDSTGFSGLIAVTGITNHKQFANTIRQQQQTIAEGRAHSHRTDRGP